MSKETRPYRFERVEEIFEYIPDPLVSKTFDEVFHSGKFKWEGSARGDVREIFEAIRFVTVRDGALESHLFSLRKDNGVIEFTGRELTAGIVSILPGFEQQLCTKMQREGLQTAAVMVVSKTKSGERGSSIAYPEVLREFCSAEGDIEESAAQLAVAILRNTPLKPRSCTFPTLAVNWAPGCDIKPGLLTSKRIVLDWDNEEQYIGLPPLQSFANSLLVSRLGNFLAEE